MKAGPVIHPHDKDWLRAQLRRALHHNSLDRPEWSSFQFLLLGNWDPNKWGRLNAGVDFPCPDGEDVSYWGLTETKLSGNPGYYFVSNREVFLAHVSRRYGKQAVLSALMELEAT